MAQSHDTEPPYPIPFAKKSFDVAETAAILSVSESTLFALLKTGRLRSFKIGRARRITGEAIDSFRGAQS